MADGPVASTAQATDRKALWLGRAWPYLLVTLVGLWVLWPSPFGGPIRSADHVVHLARAQLWADQLAQGQLRGWTWAWFFGAPIGELYPPLSDLLVLGLRVLTLGLVSWPTAYAFAFAFAFCLQGWVLVVLARRLSLGALVGVVAASCALLDPGFTREGGFMYTVYFGVWPQALSTSLCWLALAFLVESPAQARVPVVAPRPGLAALAWGLAILAHPIALPVGALTLVAWVVFSPTREGFGEVFVRTSVAWGFALLLAAWWLLPMLEHRAWMASYGWLFAPLQKMLEWLGDGRWAQRMPPAVGYAAIAGVSLALVRGPRPLRALAVSSVGLWLLASSDVFWQLRLDRLSEGFTHIQYQRFLIAAKPGLYLLGAWVAVSPWVEHGPALLARLRRSSTPAVAGQPRFAYLSLALGLAMVVWMLRDTSRAAREHGVGEVQMHRGYGDVEIDDEDFAAALAWIEDRREQSDTFWRFSVRDSRNVHWFMDASAYTQAPLYKSGFTPGDNFVHKPESGSRDMLDVLRVRYLIRRVAHERALPKEVARFGDLHIIERALPTRSETATAGTGPLRVRLQGPGTVTARDQSPLHLRFDAVDTSPESRLVFDVAGHPGWRIEHEGAPVSWHEVPAWSRPDDPAQRATVEARRRGALRGGRAQGDTGREPILIAVAPATDGSYTIRFDPPATRGRVGAALTLLACVWLLWAWRRDASWAPAAARRLRLWHLGLAVLAVGLWAGSRWLTARSAEKNTILGWAQVGPGVTAGPLKTDMLIRPSLRVQVPSNGTREVTLAGVPCDQALSGWVAIDDDESKVTRNARAGYDVSLSSAGSAKGLAQVHVPHRAGRVALHVAPVACDGQSAGATLQLTVENPNPAARTLGLWLAPQAPSGDSEARP